MRPLFALFFALLSCISIACDDAPQPSASEQAPKPAQPTGAHLVLYTSVDASVSGPIMDDFHRKTGILVTLITDTDAQKSYVLPKRLRDEAGDPKADVWWGNEPFHTINLAKDGLLDPYESPNSTAVLASYKDPDHRWAGNGLRMRALAVRSGVPVTDLTNLDNIKSSDIKGKIAISKPNNGAMAGHVGALYALWGEYRFRNFFQELRDDDVLILPSSAAVVEAVCKGDAFVGLADSDLIDAAIAKGADISIQFTDQNEFGTLAVPTTVGLVAGSRDVASAQKMIDYLLSPEVEEKLIAVHYAGWSVRGDTGKIRTMSTDYRAAASVMDKAVKMADTVLAGKHVAE